MALMENHVEINKQNIVNLLLDKAGFSSFNFACNFSLTFDCLPMKNVKLPRSVSLIVESDWWFGNENEWKQIVRKMTAGHSCIEPDELVLAFKLAALRWSADSTIQKIDLSESNLHISFNSGDDITILNHTSYDCECAWEIVECGFNSAMPRDYWWVSCDTVGNINYNIPADFYRM